MARRSDPPAVQAAKGNANRRKGANQARAKRAQTVAELLTASLEAGSIEKVPALLTGDKEAIAVWNNLAPMLAKTHRLQPQHRPMFIQFCVYYAQWAFANAELRKRGKGYTQKVATVAGGFMDRMNPMVRIRDDAYRNCMEMSARFGLTPHDEYKLFKDQAAAATGNPWLFGDVPQGEAKPAASAGVSLIGSLDDMGSMPPPTIN